MNEIIKSILPFLGTALVGPLGGAAASFLGDKLGMSGATIDSVKAVLGGMSPEKLAELKEHEDEFKLKMAALGYDSVAKLEELNVRTLESVNKTMQVEASSEHWPSFSWRPFIGASFGMYINSMWMLPLFHITPVILTPDTILAIGGILGVASWFRGKAQADSSVLATAISSKG